jgi:hypothetical protein
MKNYLVLASFAGYDKNEDELFTNQWTVGSFDTLEECYGACEKDIEQVAKDTFEPAYDADEADELNKEIKDYTDCATKVHKNEVDLVYLEKSLIYYLEYNNDNFKNNIDYFILKIN